MQQNERRETRRKNTKKQQKQSCATIDHVQKPPQSAFAFVGKLFGYYRNIKLAWDGLKFIFPDVAAKLESLLDLL